MGSAVTVFMDVTKDERGEILFSPTRAGCGDVPDVPDVPEVPDGDSVPRQVCEGAGGRGEAGGAAVDFLH